MNFRIIYISFVVLGLTFLALQTKIIDRRFQLPIFLKHDLIAEKHNAAISVTVESGVRPNDLQVEVLKKDYDALWAHLNYLYSTNDVNPGKEYYTEDWFRVICTGNPQRCQLPVSRQDLDHFLHIIDWSADGLVCTVIDSSVLLKYSFKRNKTADSLVYTRACYAISLLFQGDHWRIDGLHLIAEENEKRIEGAFSGNTELMVANKPGHKENNYLYKKPIP